MTIAIEQLRQWIGRSEQRHARLDPVPAQALAATLDRDDVLQDGEVLPAPYHWLYFLPAVPQSQLGVDGHPARGGLLPPVPLPRRMWAGGRLSFLLPLRLGEQMSKRSEVIDVQHKSGKSGELVFVTVQHRIFNADGVLALEEEQDLVYRDAPTASITAAAPPVEHRPAIWQRELRPDPVLLFRYSALSFNSHRIHYDLPYATEVEGYPGLVVHGPLIATLLLDHLRRHSEQPLRSFEFKAVRPLIAGTTLRLCGQPGSGLASLWAEDADGHICMQASARFG